DYLAHNRNGAPMVAHEAPAIHGAVERLKMFVHKINKHALFNPQSTLILCSMFAFMYRC
ncbi:hypothetical protein CEP51_015729, partial [Fusarium floridanum]